ncbi:MAG: hypothetical protein F4069_09610, partial [Rhodothermaceae bacterium]|nr:hypothetical protein [Rhodothermaceae bacterium]
MKKKSIHKAQKRFRKMGLLQTVRACFAEIEDTVAGRGYILTDYLLSGLAVFVLKYPSLLEFDKRARGGDLPVLQNLRTLFGIRKVPSDSALRERLDTLSPRALRPAFKKFFAQLQRSKVLEAYKYI